MELHAMETCWTLQVQQPAQNEQVKLRLLGLQLEVGLGPPLTVPKRYLVTEVLIVNPPRVSAWSVDVEVLHDQVHKPNRSPDMRKHGEICKHRLTRNISQSEISCITDAIDHL